MLKGFKEFIMRGNVVELAVAVVIGAAFGAVVTALVKDIITPLIAAIGGKPDFSNLTFTVNKSKFFYGDFINAIIGFIIVAAAIYFIVVLPLNKLAERRLARQAEGKPDPDPAPKSEDVILLEQIRDLLAGRGSVAQAGRHDADPASTPKPNPQ